MCTVIPLSPLFAVFPISFHQFFLNLIPGQGWWWSSCYLVETRAVRARTERRAHTGWSIDPRIDGSYTGNNICRRFIPTDKGITLTTRFAVINYIDPKENELPVAAITPVNAPIIIDDAAINVACRNGNSFEINNRSRFDFNLNVLLNGPLNIRPGHERTSETTSTWLTFRIPCASVDRTIIPRWV